MNAANFLLAEMVGVIVPFMNVLLRQHGWNYADIGVATALAGFGLFFMQIPAGILSDRVRNQGLLLAVTSLGLGLCCGLLPFSVEKHFWIYVLLFSGGAFASFFVPLLASLALSLVGRKRLDSTMGENQSWNHAGNIASAMLALLLVKYLGIVAVFEMIAVISVLAATSVFLIRADNAGAAGALEDVSSRERPVFKPRFKWSDLLRDRTIRILLVSVALFHLANAPVMPLVGLYLKHLGGGNDQVAWAVLIAQTVMVPVAWLAGKECSARGRKPVFAVAFLILPIRIALYSFTRNPMLLLAIQALDGIGAGVYGVVIALICSDLTRHTQGFNTLMGLAQAALALGGVLGPLLQGLSTEHLGFPAAFRILAGIAGLGAILFLLKMPETLERT